MSSWVDLFLYDIAHARQQDLLEAARASRVLAATETTNLAGPRWALGNRFRRRPTSNPPSVLEGASHQQGCDAVFSQRLPTRKDAA